MFVLFNYFINLAERWFVLTIGDFWQKISPLKLRDLQVLKRESEEIENEEGFGHPPDNAIPADEMERPGGGSLMERMVFKKNVSRDVFFVCPMSSQFWFVLKIDEQKVSQPAFWWLLPSFVAIYMLLFENWSRHWFSKASKDEWLHPFRCEELQGEEPKLVLRETLGGLARYFNSWI